MPKPILQVVWRPEDAAEVFARAATFQAELAAQPPQISEEVDA